MYNLKNDISGWWGFLDINKVPGLREKGCLPQ